MNIVPYSVKCKSLSLVCLFAAPWTVAWQALLSMGRILRVGSDSLFQGIFPTQGSALAVFLAGKFFTIWVTSFLCYTVNLCCWSILCISWTVSVQSLSPVWLFATPWIAACQASLSITNSQSSLRLMSIELVMPSSHLILCRLLLLLPPIPPSIRVFSNESTLRMRWPKYWSFSFSIIPSKEIPGLISA